MAEVISRAEAEALAASSGFTRRRRERMARLASRAAGVDSGLRRSGHGWRRSEQDEQLLQFVTLHGVILLRQAAKWFYDGSEDRAFRRVVKMRDAGLLNTDSGVAAWAGTAITPTTTGQKVGVMELPKVFHRLTRRAVSVPDNLLHATLVADHLLMRTRGDSRVRALTERQIRLLDGHDDPDEVREFLESQGVRFSTSEFEPGVRPGRVFRQRNVGGQVVTEESSTFLSVPVPAPGQSPHTREPHSVRYPDFVYVTPRNGEMVAVEVEIATKPSDRLGAIVAGYSRSVARMVPDGVGGFKTISGVDAAGNEVTRTAWRRHQFRQVEWLCIDESANLLCGRRDPRAQKRRDNGMIPTAMPFEYKNPGGSGLRVDWDQLPAVMPMQVHLVTADDIGVRYRLDQRELSPQYRCSYQRWQVWRRVWENDVEPELRGTVRFTRWLSGQSAHGPFSNYEYCLLTENRLANTVGPRPDEVA
ncbi:hypothetical protein [Gordonia alkanivorans]|uniref:hypothetical protein n=1 Tax=Gordonia alkanivorans TaxID=84096 RepID=UPI0018CC136F|nr:hypothetical protein [Gordonia alkanivorans]